MLSFAGCTTLQPIENFSPSRIQQQVEVGDRVEIVTLESVTYDLEVTIVEKDWLQGRSRSGKQYKVMYEAIRTIKVQDISGWRTATAAGAVVTTVVVVVVALALYYLAKALGDSDD